MTKATTKTKNRAGGPARVGLAARRAAVDSLGHIVDDARMLETELDTETGHAGYRALIAKDRALVRAIVATALRRRGQIEDALSRLIDKPLPAKARRATHILHVGAVQILFMDVADHAAVSLAADLAGAEPRLRPWKKLVNGVLRNLVRQRDEILGAQDAARLNTAGWLWERWARNYGMSTARAIAEAHLREPNLDVSVMNNAGNWAERLGATVLPNGSLRLIPKGNIAHLDGFSEGAWWVQDAAAAIPAKLLGDVAGKRVADLCAAPGGKTAQLAAAGATVTAVDSSSARLERLRENLGRLKLKADIVTADLLEWSPDACFDAILLDAPCTATGTIRRHPDIPLRKRAGDVAAVAKTQAEMLRRAVSWLAPGGVLVYCTCSLEPEEGEDIVDGLLGADPSVRRVPLSAEDLCGFEECLTENGDFRSLPSQLRLSDARLSGLDGFYAARICRQ